MTHIQFLRTKTKHLSGMSTAIGMVMLSGQAVSAEPVQLTFGGSADLEQVLFGDDPSFAGQSKHSLSFAIRPEIEASWSGDKFDTTLTFAPFYRYDPNDDARTNFDLREAKATLNFGKTEVVLGFAQQFWGKTEVDQIVDIINQTDAAEGTDGEDKLGQPLISISHVFELGDATLNGSFYYMPYFRERTFRGRGSRLRSGTLISNDRSTFATGVDTRTASFAARIDLTYGNLDMGVSAFHGVSRDPSFQFDQASGMLIPHYDKISQIGIDAQYTGDATLYKFEGIHRKGQRNFSFEKEDYTAFIVGIEHTLYGLRGTNADLGLIAEYVYDSRGDQALTVFQDDLVLGARLALNDTQDTALLVTSAFDLDSDEILVRIEGDYRFNDSLSLGIEAGAVLKSSMKSLAYDQRNDPYIATRLTYSW
ncbi:MAG: hypothetical protein AB8B71_00035 [Paracoccaceae bacterium]